MKNIVQSYVHMHYIMYKYTNKNIAEKGGSLFFRDL